MKDPNKMLKEIGKGAYGRSFAYKAGVKAREILEAGLAFLSAREADGGRAKKEPPPKP